MPANAPAIAPAVNTPAFTAKFKTVVANGWAASTLETYGSALRTFHAACDDLGIAEIDRAPIHSDVLLQVLVHLAGTRSTSTLKNVHAAVRAWHILNRLPWDIDETQLDKVFDAARAIAPPAQTKRAPYTVATLERVLAALAPDGSLDVAVYACACLLFWCIARTGELTVPSIARPDSGRMVRPCHVKDEQDRQGRPVTSIHVPSTKASRFLGETLQCAAQPGPSNPTAALRLQLQRNRPLDHEHLFTYTTAGGVRRPLSRHVFLARIRAAALQAGMPALSGHAFCIGGTLEYLLRGLSLETVRILGRWASDAFKTYLRQHAQVLAQYIQADPGLQRTLAAVLPPVR